MALNHFVALTVTSSLTTTPSGQQKLYHKSPMVWCDHHRSSRDSIACHLRLRSPKDKIMPHYAQLFRIHSATYKVLSARGANSTRQPWLGHCLGLRCQCWLLVVGQRWSLSWEGFTQASPIPVGSFTASLATSPKHQPQHKWRGWRSYWQWKWFRCSTQMVLSAATTEQVLLARITIGCTCKMRTQQKSINF